MSATPAAAADDAFVKARHAQFVEALCSKDVDRYCAWYAEDLRSDKYGMEDVQGRTKPQAREAQELLFSTCDFTTETITLHGTRELTTWEFTVNLTCIKEDERSKLKVGQKINARGISLQWWDLEAPVRENGEGSRMKRLTEYAIVVG